MNLKNSAVLILVFLSLLSPRVSCADELKQFLNYCTYGALGGALLGTATLALSEDPGNQTKNIARGASLGLYVGIGYGLYKLNSEVPPPPVVPDEEITSVWGVSVLPVHGEANWSAFFSRSF